jgi:hypothetical protein
MSKGTKLADIIRGCEVKFNRGDAARWKHSDYIDLNRAIFNESDINISTNTLKRIFGKIAVDDDYLPQQATVDALIKYSGYITTGSEPQNSASDAAPADIINNPGIFKKYKRFFTASVIIIVICIVAASVLFKSAKKFSGNIVITDTEGILPSTVFFDVQLPDSKDSLFVNFGDKSPLMNVKADQKNLAHNYLFPGVFMVSLQTKQDTIATTKVYIRSNKWIGLGFHSQLDLPNRHYEFPAVKTGVDSLFNINNLQLYKAGLDTTGKIFIRLCNYTPTGYDADDFVFETTLKNTLHQKGIACQAAQFQISGLNSFIRFKLVSPGCSYWVLNMVSEQVFSGSKTNLSQFAIELETWNTIKLINKNKHLTLLVNGKQLFEGTYQKPLGEIKGLFLELEGNGFVKNCSLKTGEGKQLYHF